MLDDRQFDLKIRSIMENGEEEVPEHIWDAVQERLSVAGHRKTRFPVWLRNTGIGMAAAAAAAFAMVFLWRAPEDSTNALTAEVTEAAVSTPGTGMTGIGNDATPAAGDKADGNDTTSETGMTGIGNDTTRESVPADAIIRTRQTDRREAVSADGGQKDVHVTATEDAAAGIAETDTDSAEQEVEPAATEEKDRFDVIKDNGQVLLADAAFGLPEEDAAGRRPGISLDIFGNVLSNNAGDSPARRSAPMYSAGETPRNMLYEENATSYGIPVSLGAGVKVSFTPRWSISAGVNWTMLTRTLSGVYYDADGNDHADQDIRNSQHYIGIPVNVYYNILDGRHVNFYAYAGGTIEKCISDKYLIDSPEQPLTYKGTSKGVQFSANIGIGVEFMVAERLGIYIDPSVRYYFESSQPKSIRTVQPLMLGFEAGLRVRL